ncbi:hypothetical protein SADUNF_Sadunf12G0076500 [Salix dunnii]|uniref:Uncharacterized protein n=1 Tax=Salix dunnii TaxID=1413687 RepID=A0A835JI90_9ROSI|nr:hypothetical protein SADUNF_Sadunf12G0076500 [Salix dunnii]
MTKENWKTSTAGFEPARAKPNRFQVCLLNHSDISTPTHQPLVDRVPLDLSTSKITNLTTQNLPPKLIRCTNLLSLALTVTLNSPISCLAIAPLNSQSPLLFPTTHFLNTRTCRLDYKMDILMKLHFFSFFISSTSWVKCVWFICLCCFYFVQCSVLVEKSGLAHLQTQVAFQQIRDLHHLHSHGEFRRTVIYTCLVVNFVKELQETILKMQKNAKIQVIEDTPNCNQHHIYATIVDGGFDGEVVEFSVEGDVVANRSMATIVTSVYPFTATLGDSWDSKKECGKSWTN